MFLFPFLKQNNEIRDALYKFPPISPPNAGKYLHFRHDSIGPSSVLPITRFLSGHFVNSDYFVLLRNSEVFMIVYTN